MVDPSTATFFAEADVEADCALYVIHHVGVLLSTYELRIRLVSLVARLATVLVAKLFVSLSL